MKIPFGKYFGWDVSDVPGSYLTMILRDESEKTALMKEIRNEAVRRGLIEESPKEEVLDLNPDVFALALQTGVEELRDKIRRRRQKKTEEQKALLQELDKIQLYLASDHNEETQETSQAVSR